MSNYPAGVTDNSVSLDETVIRYNCDAPMLYMPHAVAYGVIHAAIEAYAKAPLGVDTYVVVGQGAYYNALRQAITAEDKSEGDFYVPVHLVDRTLKRFEKQVNSTYALTRGTVLPATRKSFLHALNGYLVMGKNIPAEEKCPFDGRIEVESGWTVAYAVCPVCDQQAAVSLDDPRP